MFVCYITKNLIHLRNNISCSGCFDVCDDDVATGSPSPKDSILSDSEQQNQMPLSPKAEGQEAGRGDVGSLGESNSLPRSVNPQQSFFWKGSMPQDNVPSPKKFIGDVDR